MRTRWLLNLLLLLVVAGLAALAYLRPGLDTGETADTLSQRLPEQIQQLQIERPGRDVITIARTVDGWQLTTPITLPANRFRIEPLLQLVRAVKHSSFLVVDDALAQYGLAEPTVWLSIDGERYAFGGLEPLNGYRYVMHGAEVHLLTDRIYHYLLMSPYDFVSPQLLPPAVELVEARVATHEVRDGLQLEGWREMQARRVSAYSEFVDDAEQLVFVLSDETLLQVDILQREPEFVLGVRDRQVRYHFTEAAGEQLMQLLEGDDA